MQRFTNHRRSAFTLLEFTVAMVVLGIALAGVFPLMVVCSRGVESLELRYTAEGGKKDAWFSPVFRPDVSDSRTSRDDYGAWYLVPSADPWARKLGCAASLSKTPPAADACLSPIIIDDNDGAGYSQTGTWTTTADAQAFRGGFRRHEAQDPPQDIAVWTFSNVAPGRCHVLAKWPALGEDGGSAQFTVYDGAADPSPVAVAADQTSSSSGSLYEGWALLATRRFAASDRVVKVILAANAEKAVAADAVRIVPVASVLSIDKAFDSEQVTVRVRIGDAP